MTTAPCASNPAMFESTKPLDVIAAQQICATCPIIDTCRDLWNQLSHYDQTQFCGTWAGHSQHTVNGQPKPIADPIRNHGTYAGYQFHNRYQIPMCDDCKAANTAYQAGKRAKAPGLCRWCGGKTSKPETTSCRPCTTRRANQEGRMNQTRCEVCGYFKSKTAALCQRCHQAALKAARRAS